MKIRDPLIDYLLPLFCVSLFATLVKPLALVMCGIHLAGKLLDVFIRFIIIFFFSCMEIV